jgi:hypothetical protein
VKRLLVVSITILAIAIGFFVVTEIRGRQRLNNIPEPLALQPDTHTHDGTSAHTHHYDVSGVKVEVLEETGITPDGYKPVSDEEEINEFMEEIYRQDEAEKCCPEEELIETDSETPKKPFRERLREKYLAILNDPVKVDRYMELSDRVLRFEPFTFYEEDEYWDLKVIFNRTESTLKNYEKWKQMSRHIDPDSWTFAGRGE